MSGGEISGRGWKLPDWEPFLLGFLVHSTHICYIKLLDSTLFNGLAVESNTET